MDKACNSSIDQLSARKPNLYLTGFMGTGKSTVGALLAPRLGLRYLDSDQVIEKREGLTVKGIFERRGEARFRSLERRFIEEGHPAYGCLVACGGGLSVPPGMLDLLESKGLVVCLFASPETIFRHTVCDGETKGGRPLLGGEDKRGRIDYLLKERLPVYNRTRLRVSIENRTPLEVAEHIAQLYHREAKGFFHKQGE